MSVPIERVRPGALFRFRSGPRRVTAVGPRIGSGFTVEWEYADGKAREGRTTGSLWVHYFCQEAIEEIRGGITSLGPSRTLRSGRAVLNHQEEVHIRLSTRCPGKWAFADLETGELWGHDGKQFVRLNAEDAASLAMLANQAPEAKSA